MTRPPGAGRSTAQNCKKNNIPYFSDFDSGRQGIVHVVGPELGVTHLA